MSTKEPPHAPLVANLVDEPAERRRRIRRLLVLILLLSIGVHLVAGVGAGIWVIARYLAQPKAQFVVQKQVKMDPQDREHRLQMEEVTSLRPKPVFDNRIQSLRPSKLALPELPRVPLDTVTPIDTESLISDQIDGMGQYGQGSGSGGGFFGGEGVSGSGLLAGTLYDLKRDAQGKKTVIDRPAVGRTAQGGVIGDPVAGAAYYDVVNRLSRSNSPDSILGRYFRAPKTLYLPAVAIPRIDANEAPKAFDVANVMEARYWIAVYQGRAVAPDTGSYRFLGHADDVLMVKINGRLVFDGSLGNASRLHGKEGLTFSVEAGKAYDIEIIVGESPGGAFSAWLQIEKLGSGEDPYWFRMTDTPVKFPDVRTPAKKINGPIWRPASSAQSHLDAGL